MIKKTTKKQLYIEDCSPFEKVPLLLPRELARLGLAYDNVYGYEERSIGLLQVNGSTST